MRDLYLVKTMGNAVEGFKICTRNGLNSRWNWLYSANKKAHLPGNTYHVNHSQNFLSVLVEYAYYLTKSG